MNGLLLRLIGGGTLLIYTVKRYRFWKIAVCLMGSRVSPLTRNWSVALIVGARHAVPLQRMCHSIVAGSAGIAAISDCV
jgi:hypothetical protein